MIRFLKQVELRPIEWLGLLLVAALVFVWPIRGTIALRNILLIAAISVWLADWLRSPAPKPRLAALRAPLLWYGALTAWLLAGAFFISVDPAWSLLELKGQWLRSAAAGLLGFLLACWAVRSRVDSQRVMLGLLVLVIPFSLQVALTLADTVWLWISQGYLPERIARLTGGKLGMSVNVNFLFAFLLADLLARSRKANPLLPLSLRQVLALGIAGLACTYFIGARNGTFCLVVLLAVALGLHLRGRPRGGRELAGVVAVALALMAVAYAGFKSDYRWQAFEESAVLAWDTKNHRAWLDDTKHPLPLLHDGRKAEVSTYMRIAWFKEGVLALAERPLGVGFGRNAMGRAFHEKYGEGIGGHADNGLIDFSLAAGVPGTILGAGLLASLLLLGWRNLDRGQMAIALALLLVVATYALRTLLDSTTRDNYLEQFFLMASLLATLAIANLGEALRVPGSAQVAEIGSREAG